MFWGDCGVGAPLQAKQTGILRLNSQTFTSTVAALETWSVLIEPSFFIAIAIGVLLSKVTVFIYELAN